MASVSHKGAISFALVHIPVSFYTATRDNKVSFNQLHRQTHQRIRYKKVLDDGTEVKPEDIVKGYEHEKDQYVILEDADFEVIKTENDKSIQILHFAQVEEIDPIYYEKSYYIIPDAGGDKAFELLRTAMLEEGKVAIARTVIRDNETLIALLPTSNGMLAETLFYQDEIKPMPKAYTQVPVNADELQVAKTLIGSMVKPFEPSDYKDEYTERLRAAIAQKIEGKEITAPQPEAGGNVISLMDALKASLEQQDGDKPKKRTRRKAAAK